MAAKQIQRAAILRPVRLGANNQLIDFVGGDGAQRFAENGAENAVSLGDAEADAMAVIIRENGNQISIAIYAEVILRNVVVQDGDVRFAGGDCPDTGAPVVKIKELLRREIPQKKPGRRAGTVHHGHCARQKIHIGILLLNPAVVGGKKRVGDADAVFRRMEKIVGIAGKNQWLRLSAGH
ncbi:hypothetical protein SDC9_108726 [bioreactor metagenome]|uniref:Uncharacterized protein n=1 Tax=bioreactor metagenome TaxID=1076179 RepID=A0A645BFB2_9ZZZZ